jgi:hypothetical protein
MSEASAPSAPAALPTSINEAPPSASPANDNAQASAPIVANDNGAPPTAEEIFHAENLGDLAAKKWRLKNGETERIVDTNELLRLGQIGHAGYEAFRKAADEKRAVAEERQKFDQQRQAFDQALRTRPLDVIRQMGLEDAIIQAYQEELHYQQLPADQRARAELDRERQALQQQQQAWQRQQQQLKQQAQQAQLQQQAQQARAKFVADYGAALDAAGVPNDPHVRETAMHLMAAEHERLFEQGVPVETLARNASDRLRKLGVSFRPPPEKAREEYGEEWVRSLQQADVQRLQQPRAQNGQFVPAASAKPAQAAPARQLYSSKSDFKKLLDGR